MIIFNMKNLEQYKAIGEQKKQESQKNKEDKEWADKATKYAKEAYGRKAAEAKDQARIAKREAAAVKRDERKEKIQEAGKNVREKIGKTVDNASLLRRALPEIGKDAVADLKQGTENKINRLTERGQETFNKCSDKIENARSGVRGWIGRWQENRKVKETQKLIRECMPIIQQITENVGGMRKRNQEKMKPGIENLKNLLELKAVINQGGEGGVKIREYIFEGAAMGI